MHQKRGKILWEIMSHKYQKLAKVIYHYKLTVLLNSNLRGKCHDERVFSKAKRGNLHSVKMTNLKLMSNTEKRALAFKMFLDLN